MYHSQLTYKVGLQPSKSVVLTADVFFFFLILTLPPMVAFVYGVGWPIRLHFWFTKTKKQPVRWSSSSVPPSEGNTWRTSAHSTRLGVNFLCMGHCAQDPCTVMEVLIGDEERYVRNAPINSVFRTPSRVRRSTLYTVPKHSL